MLPRAIFSTNVHRSPCTEWYNGAKHTATPSKHLDNLPALNSSEPFARRRHLFSAIFHIFLGRVAGYCACAFPTAHATHVLFFDAYMSSPRKGWHRKIPRTMRSGTSKPYSLQRTEGYASYILCCSNIIVLGITI